MTARMPPARLGRSEWLSLVLAVVALVASAVLVIAAVMAAAQR